jgi:hypothetical protein
VHAYTVETGNWWAKKREATAEWIANYQHSVQSPQRMAIEQIVRELAPETLFEVGRHCGPNLVRLARASSRAGMHGIDASLRRSGPGKVWLEDTRADGSRALTCQRFPGGHRGDADRVRGRRLELLHAGVHRAGGSRRGVVRDRAVGGARGHSRRADAATERPRPIRAGDGYSEWAHDYQAALGWVGSLRDVTTRIVPIEPSVDRLNAILVVERLDATASSTP